MSPGVAFLAFLAFFGALLAAAISYDDNAAARRAEAIRIHFEAACVRSGGEPAHNGAAHVCLYPVGVEPPAPPPTEKETTA